MFPFSEVEEILGYYGNFIARVKKKATSVDSETCIGCGACVAACPNASAMLFTVADGGTGSPMLRRSCLKSSLSSAFLIVWIGVYPNFFLAVAEAAVRNLVMP